MCLNCGAPYVVRQNGKVVETNMATPPDDVDENGKFWFGFAGPFDTTEERDAFAAVAQPNPH